MKIRIKYFEGATKLQKIEKGNWIDVYANKDMFIPEGTGAKIPLGFALELPKGWEGHVAPRSSTFKTWGIIQTNSVGIVDDTYIGDNDEWSMPVFCLKGKEGCVCGADGQLVSVSLEEIKNDNISDLYSPNAKFIKGVIIRKGDKVGQFRIMESMPEIEFEETDKLNNPDRGGYGTTGK